MSLRDFIRATTKDIQDRKAKKTATAEQLPPNQTESETTAVSTAAEEKDEAKKGEPAPTRKKTKRGE